LTLARDPLAVADIVRRAGLPCVDVVPATTSPADNAQWLVKPIRSAGGQGIRSWDGSALRRRSVYLQRYVAGDSYSACYIGHENATRLLGVTRQLVGEEWLHAPPFHYCGSIGPITLHDSARSQVEKLGLALATGCQLRGLFGVDLVLNDNTFWPVEINPRYTASVEVLEHATGLSALEAHRDVFENQTIQPVRAGSVSDRSTPHSGRLRSRLAGVVGKAILFARQDFTFPATGPWSSSLSAPVNEMRAFADVPHSGQRITTAHPILTCFARADSESACLQALREIAADLDRRLFGR
jgi:predicted ATP-grasp superfamily ATP-dependent carboligase